MLHLLQKDILLETHLFKPYMPEESYMNYLFNCQEFLMYYIKKNHFDKFIATFHFLSFVPFTKESQ